MRKTFSNEFLIAQAKKCKTRAELKAMDQSFYEAIRARKLQPVAFAHMEHQRKSLTDKELIALAKKFGTIADFIKQHQGHYNAIRARGLHDLAFAHTKSKSEVAFQSFLVKAKKVHGKNFDYSKVVFSATKNIEIICKNHGPIFMLPNNHIKSKYGCLECFRDSSYKTDDELFAIAKKYKTKDQFRVGDYRAYMLLKERDLFDEATDHMQNRSKRESKYTDKYLIYFAKKYKAQSLLRKDAEPIFTAICKRGLQEKAFPHMVDGNLFVERKWNFEACKNEALKHKTRSDFQRSCHSAYQSALKNGWLDKICKHMEYNLGSANDSMYFYKTDLMYNGMAVYKSGSTSVRLGDKRIKEVAKAGDFNAEVIVHCKVKIRATLIEKMVQSIGIDPKVEKFNGSTELRAMNDKQARQVAETILKYMA